MITNTNYIIHTVNSIVKKTGTRNPKEICSALNFDIRYMNLQKRLKAYYFHIARIKNIIIDENINKDYIDILIAHELGHGILHDTIDLFEETDIFSMDTIDINEYEANLFAAELLLEDEVVWEELHVSGRSYYEIARSLGVPISLMEFKLILLKNKGYIMDNLPTTKADFLKYENAAYDEWYD